MLYPEYTDQWDNLRFRERILDRIDPEARVLDFGAGRGALEAMRFRGRVAHMAGVDPDQAIAENEYLDEAKVLPLPSGEIPFADKAFDLVVSNNVFEHLPEPLVALNELFRVLAPGGSLLVKTPNKFHYIPAVAAMTPHAFHVFYNRLRGREARDTFPTHYRCNSAGTLRSLSAAAGFRVVCVERWEGRPEYLRIAAPLYLGGFVYERLVNSTEWLAGLRCVLYAELKKPG